MTKYFITFPKLWHTIDWTKAAIMRGGNLLCVGTDEDKWPWFWDEVDSCAVMGYWAHHHVRGGIVWIDEDDPRYDSVAAFHLSCLHGQPELEFLRRAIDWFTP